MVDNRGGGGRIYAYLYIYIYIHMYMVPPPVLSTSFGVNSADPLTCLPV